MGNEAIVLRRRSRAPAVVAAALRVSGAPCDGARMLIGRANRGSSAEAPSACAYSKECVSARGPGNSFAEASPRMRYGRVGSMGRPPARTLCQGASEFASAPHGVGEPADACRRCNVTMQDRALAARRAWCLVPVLVGASGAVAALAWARRHAWPARAEGSVAPAPPEPPPASEFLPALRSHALLRPPGHVASLCVHCGQTPKGAVEAGAPTARCCGPSLRRRTAPRCAHGCGSAPQPPLAP